jgi:Mg-chelatase subunit ChlD
MDTPGLCRKGDAARALGIVAGVCLVALGCARQAPTPRTQPAPVVGAGTTYYLDLPRVEARPGTAVAILMDTSGSMDQAVPDQQGKPRPKYQIAHDALQRIIEQTARWKKSHASETLQLGIYHFSSSVSPVLAMSDFDEAKARDAVKRIPKPKGGTAIGRALETGYQALFQAGCQRKFIVCITDGENTSGPAPDWVARHLHAQTEGAVELDFVAFDTSASQFRFLKDLKGHVVEAANGAQLQAELTKIYEHRILAEKPEPE